MTLILGADDITKNESTQIRLVSTTFKIHENWNTPKYANDIALVKLPFPVNETDSIKIISLAFGNSTFANRTGEVILFNVLL